MRMLHYLPADVESKGGNGKVDQEKCGIVSTAGEQASSPDPLFTAASGLLPDHDCHQNNSNTVVLFQKKSVTP